MKATPSEEFISALEASLADGSFIKLTLGKHRGGDATLKNVYAKLVQIKSVWHLSFTFRHTAKDVTKNLSVKEGLRLVGELLGREFRSAHLFTSKRDLQIEFNKKLEARLTESEPTHASPATREHDRRKKRLVETEGNVYLRALGVTNERGGVAAGMGDKLRQINKFVEIVAHLYASSGIAARGELSVVDMGSGKGYLTFAVYDYFRNALGKKAKVVGVETRGELVALCNRVAREAAFDGLTFEQGFIRDYEVTHADILIALHACDTATDEALFKGVEAGAAIIITAPCCQRELRPQVVAPSEMKGMLKHGIMLERQAEMLTDTLRALLLESVGYKTRVFEFISTEHTQKNTMIAAVRHEGNRDAGDALEQFEELKRFYGVREQSLEQFLRGAGAFSARGFLRRRGGGRLLGC